MEHERRSWRRMAAGLVVAGVVATLAGCGGSSGGGATSTTAPGAAATNPSTSTTVKGNLASRSATIDKQTVVVTINQLQRSGNLVTMNFSVAGPDAMTGNAQIGQSFDDGLTNQNHEGTSFTTDGAFLVDSANKKKFPVARDTDGFCVCTSGLEHAFVRAGQAVPLSATFAAPAPGVKALDVTIPSVGTFTDVPLG